MYQYALSVLIRKGDNVLL